MRTLSPKLAAHKAPALSIACAKPYRAARKNGVAQRTVFAGHGLRWAWLVPSSGLPGATAPYEACKKADARTQERPVTKEAWRCADNGNARKQDRKPIERTVI